MQIPEKKSPPSLAFFGTPELCTHFLDALQNSTVYAPSLLITNPDRAVGRNWSEPQASPVKTWGLKHDKEIFQPETLDDDAYVRLTQKKWDLFIVVAYGVIMPQRFIDIPTHGTINIHYSLLPRWRGATPVEASILAGDTETGVSIQTMRFALDSGPIIAHEKIQLTGNEYTQELRNQLSIIGAELLLNTLPRLLAGTVIPVEQDPAYITKCKLTKKEDALIHLDEPDEVLWRKYRAYYGWPGIFFFDTEGKRVKITHAEYINKKFIIKKIIPEGKKECEYRN